MDARETKVCCVSGCKQLATWILDATDDETGKTYRTFLCEAHRDESEDWSQSA